MADLLRLSREIAALAQAGIAYSRDPFDKERFARLRQIASELLQASPARDFEWPAEMGYPTPKIDVRALVFRNGEVLLVKERSSGLWTPPGRWADVNLTPAENAEKECLEESGYRVEARHVTSIRDRERAGYPPHPHAVCKIHFLCTLLGGAPVPDRLETSDVGFSRWRRSRRFVLIAARSTKSASRAISTTASRSGRASTERDERSPLHGHRRP